MREYTGVYSGNTSCKYFVFVCLFVFYWTWNYWKFSNSNLLKHFNNYFCLPGISVGFWDINAFTKNIFLPGRGWRPRLGEQALGKATGLQRGPEGVLASLSLLLVLWLLAGVLSERRPVVLLVAAFVVLCRLVVFISTLWRPSVEFPWMSVRLFLLLHLSGQGSLPWASVQSGLLCTQAALRLFGHPDPGVSHLHLPNSMIYSQTGCLIPPF